MIALKHQYDNSPLLCIQLEVLNVLICKVYEYHDGISMSHKSVC
jgi:hypothetical protein